MLTVDAHHIQSRHDRTVRPGLPSVLGSFHAHSSEMPEDPELPALLEENREHVGLRSTPSAEIDSVTTTNFAFDSFVTIFHPTVHFQNPINLCLTAFKRLRESYPKGLAIARAVFY